MRTAEELHNDNLEAQKRLLTKGELSPAELVILGALERVIGEYEDRMLSRKSLKLIKSLISAPGKLTITKYGESEDFPKNCIFMETTNKAIKFSEQGE